MPQPLPDNVHIVTVPKVVEIRHDADTRASTLGTVRHIRMWATGYEPMTWREQWEAFAKAYPGKWAVQMFPPSDQLVDGKAVYHLFVCDEEPRGLSIR